MGVLIVFIVLAFVFVFILLVSINNRTTDTQVSLRNINSKLDFLFRRLKDIETAIQQTPVADEQKAILQKDKPAPEIIPSTPATFDTPLYVEKKSTPVAPVEENQHSSSAKMPLQEEVDERTYTETAKDSWVKRNPDIERFIGENLANKIGIAVLVLGIAFFVKYAIDKNWINETGRVSVGLLCGAILIGLAHYIRKSYRSFSSVLVGGGLTVFYFTIAFAFHQYHLIGQQPAFIIMVIISAGAVALSLYYDRQELAILATIGGFVTPFLLTTGQENYIALFSYLCILNTGLMVLAWFKRWPVINIIALFFTTFIFGGWLIRRMIFLEDAPIPYRHALLFGTLFYLLFITMNIVNNLRMKRKFTAFDFIIVLSTNFLYYLAGIVILNSSNDDYKGIFTASLGIFNLLLTAMFYRHKRLDPNFVSLLTGLAITFISLIAPVQLKGNHVVLFWAAEAVVLIWLYQRSRIVQLKVASFLLTIMMLASLLLVWTNVYLDNATVIPIVINKGFITSLAVAVSLFIYYTLLRRKTDMEYIKGFSSDAVSNKFLTTSIIVGYFAGSWEILQQFSTRFPDSSLSAVYLQVYSFAFVLILLYVFRRSPYYPFLKFLMTGLSLLMYLLQLGVTYNASSGLLNSENSSWFSAHWIAAALLLWLSGDMVKFFFSSVNAPRWSSNRSLFTWIATMSIVLVLSVELYHVLLWTNYRNAEEWTWSKNLYYKAGLTILWSICSFTMMWLGMRSDFRTLRMISLTLFSITLVKLFSYDIRNIPPGGKIAAFILLGILLLTVSFMYQRLKRIIIEDKKSE